jgi:hypothetical protein
MSQNAPSHKAAAPQPQPSRTISLRREVRPTSSPGREHVSTRDSPVFCGYCVNLHGPSARQLLPSFNVSLKQTHPPRPPSAAATGPGGESPRDPNTWEFSVELADVRRQSAEGCASCTLLWAAVELATPPKYQGQDLGLTVEFREGYVLRGDVYNLLPEDEREVEFEFGGGTVDGGVSGMFDGVIGSFELYTLPGT